MRRLARLLHLLAGMLFSMFVFGQPNNLNTHILDADDGLADAVVRAIGQDKYGYIWIGTVSGLNRYDGTSFKRYFSEPGKPFCIPASVSRCIFSDTQGDLWIGFNNGLYRFDHRTENFYPVKGTEHWEIKKIRQDPVSQQLILQTSKGLVSVEKGSFRFHWMLSGQVNTVRDLEVKDSSLLVITDSLLYKIDLSSGKILRFSAPLVSENSMNKIAVARDGVIWIVCGGAPNALLKIDPSLKKSERIDLDKTRGEPLGNNGINSILVDHRNRIWLATYANWLYTYDDNTRTTSWYMNWNPYAPTLPRYITSPVFQSKNHVIWVPTEGYGVCYFHPDRNLFLTHTPFGTLLPQSSFWGRAAAAEPNGNLWFGWASGLSRVMAGTDSITHWNNYGHSKMLHNNSIRSLAWENDSTIWIGTAKGVNRYNSLTDSMYFDDPDHQLPHVFYWSIKKDSRQNIWFGVGNGLYFKSAGDNRIHRSIEIPELKPVIDTGVRVIYEDSEKRLWLGMDGTGLRMYDPDRHEVQMWKASPTGKASLLGNTITAITQDKSGLIWISSFNGLTSYNTLTGQFKQYTTEEGLPAAKCSGLLVDDANRLWIATTAGLAMLDNSRRQFTLFTTDDGLPTLEFTDMPAFRKSNGNFLFPSMGGFIEFDPLQVKPQFNESNLYLASIKIFDKPYTTDINTEELSELFLKGNENFISFQMVDLNNNNPNQRFFAYRLEDVDQDWVVNNSGIASYTKLPGGDYIFRYKTSADAEQWVVPEKTLRVHIETVYYKSSWFWLTMLSLLCIFSYLWYRNLLRQQKKIYLLQSRAQLLEKEKAMAMFEALKQQLNPHFLFNSLSSLGSLIRTDQGLAGKFLESLSKTYRYILQSRNNDLISLEEEIKFVSSYIRLLETRFQSALKTELDIETGKLNRKIVPVTLQNLIDNAIKHNSIDQDMPLVIRIFTEGQYVVVRNNIQKKGIVETSNRQGLQQLKTLYTYFTQQPILIEESPLIFQVKIPLI
ncbi:ligand-binding sensor domain-containing protein [Flavihumibacter petaseus]|uniref:Putative two-component histidine kinase n=1 Tax=Flavihumibacter petaseus NBRC 106054 TaxID=1220578 RepID=A0A0E9N836_9BACT|nr:two-component regulator propeller domain-containing protein [Flavihumibacter petaseus]GAO45540.1 putative two-component histidine kinase [Flavihumibacter petaseus NBRC 106054]